MPRSDYGSDAVTPAWEHSSGIDAPFSADAARYVRGLAARTNRHVDPRQAVRDLLTDWSKGQVASRRDRSLALRLSAQRAPDSDAVVEPGGDAGDSSDERARAALPGVVDLLSRREHRDDPLRDDLDDVFARYYDSHPEHDGLEVFDE